MCHDWWYQRKLEEREASRRLWDEFEQTRPLSDVETSDEDADVVLEKREQTPLATPTD